MHPVFIYALLDPRNEETSYVGQTIDPDERLKDHCSNKKYYCGRWIQLLKSAGLRPVMEILDVVPDTEADFWEREYIQNFRERGFRLTNISDGGHAPMRGKKFSPEHRERISASKKGQKYSPEACANMSAARKGKKLSPEHRAKISTAQKGKTRSPEHCAKISANNRRRKLSLRTRAKIGAAHKGKKISPETRAKISASLKHYNTSPKPKQ